MDKNKSHLIEVLAKKGLAFCIIHSTSEATESKQSVIENIQGVIDEILKYAEPTNKEVATYIFVLYFHNEFISTRTNYYR